MTGYGPWTFPETLTTKELLARGVEYQRKDGRMERQWSIPLAAPVKYSKKDLPIDPYLLGMWLGDGASATAVFTTGDPELLQAWESAGYTLVKCSPLKYDYRIYHALNRPGYSYFARQLAALHVKDNKHIPVMYLQGSVKQRIALLQGLMDTDGSVCKSGSVEFYNTNRTLIEQFRRRVSMAGIWG